MSCATKTHLYGVLASAILFGNIATAEAHTKLLTSLPAANTEVASPAEITLKFDEAPIPVVATLKAVGGQEITALGPVRKDGAVLHYMVTHPLAAGKYELSFRVTSSDAHVTTGTVAFTVVDGAGSNK